MSAKMKISLPAQMALGLVLGILVGCVVPQDIANDYLKPFGTLFITLIRMVVVPLVLATIVAGAAGISDLRKLGRVASKTLIYYFLTTAIAIIIGLILALLIQPGVGLNLATDNLKATQVTPPSMLTTLMNIVPLNPMDALAKGNMLQVIFFAVMFGFGLSALGERGKPLYQVFELTGVVMLYAPIGVFGLMASTVASHGIAVLLPLIKFIAVMYLAAVIHVFVTYYPCIRVGVGMNFGTFFKGVFTPVMIAFTTTSSAAALPANMRSVRQLGASKAVSSFSIPLGNTINMDGTAIYMGIAAVFAAEVYGIDLTMADYFTVMVMGVLASIGTAGVPGAVLIMVSIVFTQIHVPLEAVALIAGIDRILDMARTSLNVFGDATGALLVTKMEGELGKDPVGEEDLLI